MISSFAQNVILIICPIFQFFDSASFAIYSFPSRCISMPVFIRQPQRVINADTLSLSSAEQISYPVYPVNGTSAGGFAECRTASSFVVQRPLYPASQRLEVVALRKLDMVSPAPFSFANNKRWKKILDKFEALNIPHHPA